jgi:phage anti-repressor protein
MTTTTYSQLGSNDQALVHMIEYNLLSRMENINPVPSNAVQSRNLYDFLEIAQRYAAIVEPSEQFTRQMLAFLETMQNQQYREQQQQRQREQHVQVTRVGAKRVFGTDITREVDQNRNIANSFA